MSGCDITLVDLPPEGLALAAQRAKDDQLPGVCRVTVADGRALPYGNKSFHAITHSDVLCCLPGKQEVLAECRRGICDGGRIIFTVITVAPDLSEEDHARAIELGPPYIASETDYEEMLNMTGWTTIEKINQTAEFLHSARIFLRVDQANRVELDSVLGEEDCQLRLEDDANQVDAISQGLLCRDIYELRAP